MTIAPPPRVVLDTNCVISTLLYREGRLSWIRRAWQAGHFVPIVDRATLSELFRVLAYPKFGLSRSDQDTALALYLPYVEAIPFEVPRRDLPPIGDASDQKFVALAMRADADALVSGDRHLLDLRGIVEELRVLTPAELREWLDSGAR